MVFLGHIRPTVHVGVSEDWRGLAASISHARPCCACAAMAPEGLCAVTAHLAPALAGAVNHGQARLNLFCKSPHANLIAAT